MSDRIFSSWQKNNSYLSSALLLGSFSVLWWEALVPRVWRIVCWSDRLRRKCIIISFRNLYVMSSCCEKTAKLKLRTNRCSILFWEERRKAATKKKWCPWSSTTLKVACFGARVRWLSCPKGRSSRQKLIFVDSTTWLQNTHMFLVYLTLRIWLNLTTPRRKAERELNKRQRFMCVCVYFYAFQFMYFKDEYSSRANESFRLPASSNRMLGES